MFKYPSPWQVLCSSLERREQVQEKGEDGSFNVSNLLKEDTTEPDITDSKELPSVVTEGSNVSDDEPETIAERAPASQETHIHADSDQTDIPDDQGANIPDAQTGTAASELTMDRVTRRLFSSFSSTQSLNGSQQDLANTSEETQATEKTDKRKDVWVPPPDRRLKLLREEERFEIRSHLPEMSPTKLFVDDSDGDDDDDDDKVTPRSPELTPEKVLELQKHRIDIIKEQGQRQSLDHVIIIGDKDGGSVSHIELTGVDGRQNKPTIHTEQIDFESARQQFLKLEKARNSLPITPRLQSRQPRLHDNFPVTKKKEDQEGQCHKDDFMVTREVTGKDKSSSLLRKQFLGSLWVDSVNNEEQEKSAEGIQEEKESIPNPNDETPIEREIRLALQREESLRKERGILSLGKAKEIVEISKDSLLANSPAMLHSKKSKNRPHAASFIQKEIEREVQREADLKSEGRVAGLYDKGNSQELDERRKLFEQPDEIPVQPQQGSSAKIIANEKPCNISRADLVTDYDTKNGSGLDSPQPYSVRMKWKPATSNVYRTRRLSVDNSLEKESSDKTFVLWKENFHIKPLRFCWRVEDNDGDVERDGKIGHRGRYNIRLRPSLSNIIEQDIQQTLERDRELQEERRKSGLPPLTGHNDDELKTSMDVGPNGYDTDGTSALTTSLDVSSTWTSAPWKSTLGNISPSYDSPTGQACRPQEGPKFEDCESDGDRLKRHENWYAGIDPSDAVNTENPNNISAASDERCKGLPGVKKVIDLLYTPTKANRSQIVESTRVNRHKNTMALRWEAGLYVNEQSD